MTGTDSATLHRRLNWQRRFSACVLALIVVTSLPGCLNMRQMMVGRRDPMSGAPRLKNVSNPSVEEVVAHLNRNTDRLQSWRANSVRIRANNMPLSGTLAVEKGRHLRLVVKSIRGSEVDLGSNDERFWVWARELDPSFVTCKHENMDVARQELGIPFEPDWLMQALGVSPLPTVGVEMETDPSHEQARLVEQIVSAHGLPLRRVVLVDLRKGIVLEHSLHDYNGQKIAQAKLSEHRMDKATGVVLPQRVALDWPQNQMSMTMKLEGLQINPGSIPSNIWDMPEMPGYHIVNLDSGIEQKRVATTARINTPVQHEAQGDSHSQIQTIRSHDEHNFLRDEEFVPPTQAPGRARISLELDDYSEPAKSVPSDSDSEWDK